MADPYAPDPYIEVAFGFGPYDLPAPGDWVDITDYVDECKVSRGRENELEPFDVSSAELVLNNHDRRFDPLNTSSPYAGDLVANVPIRVRADVSGTKYDVWSGFVDAWPAEYSEGGFNKELQLKCSDVFKLLSERPAHDTMVEDIYALPGLGVIRRWYRFDRVRDGEQVIVDTLGNGTTDLFVRGKWDTQERICAASNVGALGMAQHKAPENTFNTFMGATRRIGPFDNAPIKTDHFAVAMTFRVTDFGQMGGYSLELISILNHVPGIEATGFDKILGMALHHGGKHHPDAATCPGCFTAGVDTSGPGIGVVTGPGGVNDLTGSNPFLGGTWNPFDGEAHSVVMVRHTSTLTLYGDGVLVGSATNGAAVGTPTWDTAFDLRAYWPFQGVPLAVGRTFPGVVMQEVLFMDTINVATFDPPAVHDALMVGMGGPPLPAGTAAQNLLTRMGWNLLQTAIDPGETLVNVPPNPAGRTVLEHLQRYADAEGGRLFVDRRGFVVFHAANRFQTQATETTVQYTFSDTDPSSVSLDGTLRVNVDDAYVFEAAEVGREDGELQRAETTSTPARVFRLDGLPLTSDHAAMSRAERIAFLYSTPRPRPDAWDVWPEADSADWATLLQLEIGHRVRVVATPGATGSQIDLQLHLELIEHLITPTDWVMTLNGSPVDDTVYLIWGGSGAQGWGNGKWR